MTVKRGSISQAIEKINRKPQLAAMVNPPALLFGLFFLLLSLHSHAQNTISTYAGGASSVDDLPGPTSAVRDAAGNTYIAAPYSTYVFKLSGGNVTTFAGTGIEGFGGDGGPAGSATLGLPNGLTIDSKGNIYIVDFKTSRVRMVDTTGNMTTVAGSGTKCEPSTGTCGDGGPALNAAFNFPMAVAVDNAGNLYIADAYDNRIRAVNRGAKATTLFGVNIPAGNIATIAGNGNPCGNPSSSCGDGGTPLAPTLNYPQSVALDTAGSLYIADTRDNKIRKIPSDGSTITTVAGTGGICNSIAKCGDGGPATSAGLHMPMWVFLDPSNNIYIADTNDHKVRFVSAQTSIISTVAGTGVQGFSGDGSAATSAQLNFPASVFLDSSGNLIVADSGNQRVRQVSGGIISSIAGGGMGGDGGPATGATLAYPFEVAEDAVGNLYIADTANNRIRLVNTQNPPVISTVAGTGFAGATGDGGPAVSATLNAPTGVKVDSSGNLWIADAGNNAVRKVDANTHTITTYAGMLGKSCFPPNAPCGDGFPATQATFSTPRSIALDSVGNLYIADYTAHRVRKVDAGTQIISTLAGTGIAGRKCVSGLASQANLNHPSDVAVDGAGNVYIDDSYNNMICQVSGGNIKDWALNGAYKFGGDGGPAGNASQWNPLAVAVDPSGNLFIGGGNYDCVRRVDVTPATPTIGTVAGDVGQHCAGGFAGDGGPATAAKISSVGLFVDGQSNLYIADAGNNRVRTVHLTPAVTINPPGNFGAWPLHTTSTPQTFSIISSGGIDLSLDGTSFGGNNPGDFAETGIPTCGSFPALLGVDVSCSFTLTFTPLNYGKRTATFVLSDNTATSPQMVVLSGFGPYFTVAASPNTLTINPGSEGDSTLTIAPLGGFNKTVNLVDSGCPPASTCSISRTSVTLDGTNSQTAILKIVTTPATTPGTYKVVATGEYGSGNQLQWSATVTVTIP